MHGLARGVGTNRRACLLSFECIVAVTVVVMVCCECVISLKDAGNHIKRVG